jgi:hypothetical protein
MSKNDRNTVTIGPARVKVEDSIYDAVDQGIVGTTNVTTTPTDTGFVPIGPIGDLITPPVLAPVTGYPILATAINFNDGIGTYPFLSTGTSWADINLSSLGSFTNALVVGAGSSDLAFVNLDNPSQRTTYAGKYKSGPLDFIVRDGVLTHGWSSFVGGVWVTDDIEITLNSITQTVTGASINTALQTGKNDATHRYFYLGNGWGVGSAYARIAHTGPLSLEVVCLLSFNAGINPQFSVRCVAGGVLWIGANIGNFDEYVVAIDIATGTFTSTYNIAPNLSSPSTWFGLTTGEAVYLNYTSVGIDYIYNLYIVGLDGSITAQASLITVLGGALADFVPMHGAGTTLATTTNNPTTLYQISPAGYQIVGGTPNMISLPRISDAAPGALRFWGSDGDPSYTNVALYEVAL